MSDLFEQNALAVQEKQAIAPMQPMQMIQVAFQKALESGVSAQREERNHV